MCMDPDYNLMARLSLVEDVNRLVDRSSSASEKSDGRGLGPNHRSLPHRPDEVDGPVSGCHYGRFISSLSVRYLVVRKEVSLGTTLND
jgi:hypothetical protein